LAEPGRIAIELFIGNRNQSMATPSNGHDTNGIAMSQVVPVVVAIHVLWHGVVGCCGHALAASIHVDGATCEHAPHCDHETGAAGTSFPLPSHDCPHDRCHWLAPDSVSIDSPLKNLIAPAFDILHSAIAEIGTSHVVAREIDVGRMRPMTLRLHLALGVLLL
jgi:hypothetical protein